jgi:hypothetical protein
VARRHRLLSLEAAEDLQRVAGRYVFGLPDLSDSGRCGSADGDALTPPAQRVRTSQCHPGYTSSVARAGEAGYDGP